MFQKDSLFGRTPRLHASIAMSISLGATALLFAQDTDHKAQPPSAMTSGLSAKEVSQLPGVLFARELTDVPGKNLVVVMLKFPAHAPQPPTQGAEPCRGHRHPGSTYVYVTQGTVRLGIAGQPVQVVHTGESFFEPPGALHNVAENASATEPASAIAVLIEPTGAPLVKPEKCGHP